VSTTYANCFDSDIASAISAMLARGFLGLGGLGLRKRKRAGEIGLR
jgi:LPXTG-motif cell wall-anchored protein